MSALAPGARSRLPRVPTVFSPVPVAQAVVRNLPPLVVLRAPRGFGKTSTVAHWLRSGDLDDRSAVWVTVPHGARAADLWVWLYDSLVVVGLAPELAAPDHQAVADALGRLNRRLVVVVDGLHDVIDTEVDVELVTFAQVHELLHVVVTSRVERPIESIGPAMVDAAVLRATDLALGVPEAQLLASRLGVEVTGAEVEQVVADLAGWPALVRAVLLDARRAADGRLATPMAAVARYLALALGDPELAGWREVLTAMAVPDELDPADLLVLLDDAESRRTGEFVMAHSYIIERMGNRSTYPRGLRAALLELLRSDEPERYRDLNERLARDRREKGLAAAALAHAMQAEAWPLVLGILEDHWAVLLREHAGAVDQALRAMPRQLVSSSARLMVARDYVLDRDTAVQAETALRSGLLSPAGEIPVRRLTTTQRLALRFDGVPTVAAADVLLGRLDSPLAEDVEHQLDEPVRRAVPELLTEWGLSLLYGNDGVGAAYAFAASCQEAARVGDRVAAREAATATALAMVLLGHLRTAEEWLDHATTIDAAATPLEMVARPLSRAIVAATRLQPRLGTPTDAPAVGQGLLPLVALSRIVTAFGDILHGRLDRARVELQRYGTDGDEDLEPIVRASATALRIDLALAEGRLDRAGALLAEAYDGGPWIRAARARHAFYVGAYTEALRLTQDAPSYSGARPRAGLELLLVHACAAWRLGDAGTAIDQLSAAVGIAEDTGVLLPFLTVPRADLTAIAPPGTWTRQFLDRPALADTDCPFPEPLQAGELSEAELRVLRELVAGLPLSHIGRRLFIAESTVKTHVRRIYRKLGVSSRADALLRARELSLLD